MLKGYFTFMLCLISTILTNAEQRFQVFPLNPFEVAKVLKGYQNFLKHIDKSKLLEFNHLSYNFNSNIPSLINEAITLNNQSKLNLNCTNQLEEWIKALTEKQFWAISVFDAYGKPSSGILEGSFSTIYFFITIKSVY